VVKLGHYPKLEEVCEGMRPWYSWLATVSLISFLVAFCLLIAVFSWIYQLQRGAKFYQLFVPETTLPPPNVFWFYFWLVFLTWLVHLARVRVFPRGFFALGQGKRRFQNSEIVRIGVIVAVAINLITGVILAMVL
jgi:hypothetical protein